MRNWSLSRSPLYSGAPLYLHVSKTPTYMYVCAYMCGCMNVCVSVHERVSVYCFIYIICTFGMYVRMWACIYEIVQCLVCTCRVGFL